ncbi:MAG: hypothetical protein COB85_04820 [Bacteroidetes bacterium]|nr:MAG: hypothetical protein COB85_04820 [Bacteroidota bacterium]
MTKNNSQKPNELEFETTKFGYRREPYYKGLEEISKLGYTTEDYIHHFPCFTGHMNLSRFMALYECYQNTLGIAGHIAEIGVYKGASLLFLTKLAQIYESESLTQVHGFDWFQGTPVDPESREPEGTYKESYERLIQLIKAQSLENAVFVHKLDVTTELPKFFEKHPHMQFKIVFFDIGLYSVVNTALPIFWERLSKGGYLILDQFNHEMAPGETKAVKEFLKDKEIRTFPHTFMPTAYIVK